MEFSFGWTWTIGPSSSKGSELKIWQIFDEIILIFSSQTFICTMLTGAGAAAEKDFNQLI